MDHDYIAPPKALKILKAARGLRQTVYIYGAAGYGKTELVKQYLLHRNYIYISCAERLDLEALPPKSGRRKENDTGSVVVIDDLHLLKGEAEQQEILSLLGREDVWTILISRSRIPAWLLPAHFDGVLQVIREELLHFSEKDCRRFLSCFTDDLTAEQIQMLRDDTWGNPYVLGITGQLLAEGMKPGPKLHREVSRLFADYMENAVFAQWEPELLEFLMQVSVVDEFDISLAEMITGNSYAAGLLQKAQSVGNFLKENEGIYRIQPALAEILRRRAGMVCGNECVRNYAYNAGLFYEMHDQVPQALDMYEKSGRSDRIRELLVRNARCNPGNGHYFVLRSYYLNLKEEEIEKSVILMAAMSMLYSLLMQPEKSEYWYRKLAAYEKTVRGSERREAQKRLAYLDIGLPHRGSRGLLHIMKHLPAMMLEKGEGGLPEFAVTSNRPSTMNGGKDFCHWSRYDRELAASVGKLVERILGRYGKGLTNAALGESLYEKGGDTYEILSLLTRAEMEAAGGGKLEIAFAAVGIKVRLYLLNGDIDTAKMQLHSFEKKVRDEKAGQLLPNIEALKCRLALYEGDMEAVKVWMSEAPDENREFYIVDSYRYLTKVRCYIAQGEKMKSFTLLEKLRYYSEQCQRTYVKMEVGLMTAVLRERQGDEWKTGLMEVLREACGYRFLRLISEEGPAVSGLLRQVEKDCIEDSGIDHEWFGRLLDEAGNMAVRYPVYLKRQMYSQDFTENALAILRLQAEGLSVPQIAKRLGMKERTVRYHISENYRKLGVNSKVDAMLAARSMNLL